MRAGLFVAFVEMELLSTRDLWCVAGINMLFVYISVFACGWTPYDATHGVCESVQHAVPPSAGGLDVCGGVEGPIISSTDACSPWHNMAANVALQASTRFPRRCWLLLTSLSTARQS